LRRMEALAETSPRGLQVTRAYIKESLRRRVLAVADEETRLLASAWSRPDFARAVKKYLKTSEHVIFK